MSFAFRPHGHPLVGILTALTAIVLTPHPAQAQVNDIQPHWVAVTSNDVYLRCGDGVVWYPVLRVNEGQLLHVDGKGFKWLRVAYPTGAAAFIRAEEADIDATGKSVVTNRPSRLVAANLHSGLDGSWKALLTSPIAPGAKLTLLGEIRDSKQQIVAFRVQTPSSASAYISEEFVRPATDAEVMAALGGAGNARTSRAPRVAAARKTPVSASTPSNHTPSQASITSTSAQPRSRALKPQIAPTIAAAPTAPVTLNDVLRQYGESPSTTASTQANHPRGVLAPNATMGDQSDPATHSQPSDQPSFVSAAPTAPMPPPVRNPAFVDNDFDRPLLTLAQLDAAFGNVMAEPVAGAEIGPLMHEHERYINTLLGKTGKASVIAYLRRRVKLLHIKADLQQSLRRLEEAAERAAIAKTAVDQRIRDLDASRIYPTKGRLVTSALYDGKRLPLMYRLQATGTSAVTIAYVLPGANLDLAAKLGTVVGVQGDATTDQSLGVPVIRPSRVEVLARGPLEASVPDNK